MTITTTRRPGRPRLSADTRRARLLGTRVTDAEADRIDAYAASRGLTTSDLLRLLAVTAVQPDRDALAHEGALTAA